MFNHTFHSAIRVYEKCIQNFSRKISREETTRRHTHRRKDKIKLDPEEMKV